MRCVDRSVVLLLAALCCPACATAENSIPTGENNGVVGAGGDTFGSGGANVGNGGNPVGPGGNVGNGGAFGNGGGVGNGGSFGSGGHVGSGGSGSGGALGAGGACFLGICPAGGAGGSMSVPDAGNAHKAMCNKALCVDPVFDCILQGCPDAICQIPFCVIK